ncbi:unnamed protein product [Closterium sp. NIES-65]|nr:unnamed protein product [Closterium sp. NIES-65]
MSERAMADATPQATFQLGEITADKLAEYNGSDASKPILVSLKHVIYDVTSASSFYGPDGPYSIFAGKDASRSLATMTMDDVGGSLEGLTEKQLRTLDDWVETFARKQVQRESGRGGEGEERGQMGQESGEAQGGCEKHRSGVCALDKRAAQVAQGSN